MARKRKPAQLFLFDAPVKPEPTVKPEPAYIADGWAASPPDRLADLTMAIRRDLATLASDYPDKDFIIARVAVYRAETLNGSLLRAV